jgi:hypothetical protein
VLRKSALGMDVDTLCDGLYHVKHTPEAGRPPASFSHGIFCHPDEGRAHCRAPGSLARAHRAAPPNAHLWGSLCLPWPYRPPPSPWYLWRRSLGVFTVS